MQTHFPRKYTYSIPSRYEHIKEDSNIKEFFHIMNLIQPGHL